MIFNMGSLGFDMVVEAGFDTGEYDTTLTGHKPITNGNKNAFVARNATVRLAA